MVQMYLPHFLFCHRSENLHRCHQQHHSHPEYHSWSAQSWTTESNHKPMNYTVLFHYLNRGIFIALYLIVNYVAFLWGKVQRKLFKINTDSSTFNYFKKVHDKSEWKNVYSWCGGPRINPFWWIQWATSHYSQCSTTGVTKSVVYTVNVSFQNRMVVNTSTIKKEKCNY